MTGSFCRANFWTMTMESAATGARIKETICTDVMEKVAARAGT